MRQLVPSICLLLWLGACAHGELNMNARDLGEHYGDLTAAQIAYNLQQFFSDPSTVPTHMVITTATVTTQDSISPSLGFPLDSVRSTATVLAAAGNASNPTWRPISATTTKETPDVSAGLAASFLRSQTWALAPETDPDVMRRLQALYARAAAHAPADAAAGSGGECDFFDRYGIQHSSAGVAIVPAESVCVDPGGSHAQYLAELEFLLPPACVLCLDTSQKDVLEFLGAPQAGTPVPLAVIINPALVRGVLKTSGSAPADVVIGPSEDGGTLWIRRSDLHELELAVLESVSLGNSAVGATLREGPNVPYTKTLPPGHLPIVMPQ